MKIQNAFTELKDLSLLFVFLRELLAVNCSTDFKLNLSHPHFFHSINKLLSAKKECASHKLLPRQVSF
jgi:hypothetical protein